MNEDDEQQIEKLLVYLVTNLVTNKWYVGKTKTTEPKRWSRHLSTARSGASFAISRSIRKHGPESFHRQILAENLTWEQASDLERIWITLLESYKQEFGYNLTRGGDGVRHNEETRKKVSESLTGRTYSDEAKANMRDGAIRRRVEGNGTESDFVPRSDIDENDIVKMYLDGNSLPTIAKKYNASHPCIASRLEKLGISRRSHSESVPNKKNLPVDEIVSRYQAGESATHLAEVLGTTTLTITRRLQQSGVVLRTRSEANIVRYKNQRKSTDHPAIQNQRNQNNE